MFHTLAPQAPEALFSLAIAYTLTGQTEGSERALQLLRAIDPEQAREAEDIIRQNTPAQPASPLGEGWTYAAESSNTVHWAQTGRIRRTGSTLEVWVAGLPSAGTERAFRDANDAGLTTQEARRVAKTMTHYEVNCTGNRARILSALVYDTAGMVLDQSDDPYATWAAPVPGTILEGIVDTVCAVAR